MTRRMTVTLSNEAFERIERAAKARGVSRSSVIDGLFSGPIDVEYGEVEMDLLKAYEEQLVALVDENEELTQTIKLLAEVL